MESRRTVEDALRCPLEGALKAGEPIPQHVEPALDQITLTVP